MYFLVYWVKIIFLKLLIPIKCTIKLIKTVVVNKVLSLKKKALKNHTKIFCKI